MKTPILFFLVLLFHLEAKSTPWKIVQRQPSRFENGMMFSVGLSAGQETFIGFPKFGAYKQFPIHYARCKGPQLGFRHPAIYAGVDGSLFVFFAGAFSVGPTIGYGHGPFSIDNSLTFTLITQPESVNEKNWSYNPKIGINIGPVWLKAGPSFSLYAESDWDGWVQTGNVRVVISCEIN